MLPELLTAVLAGVLVFGMSQYVLKLMIEPAAQLRRTIGEVSRTVLARQATITNGCLDEGVASELWDLASRLRADLYLVVGYDAIWLTRTFALPRKKDIREASRLLNLLAYQLTRPLEKDGTSRAIQNWQYLQELGRRLIIETTYADCLK